MFIEKMLFDPDYRPAGKPYVDLILAILFEDCLLKPIAEDEVTPLMSNIRSLGIVPSTLAVVKTCINKSFYQFNEGERKDYYVALSEKYQYHLDDYAEVFQYLTDLYNLFRVVENDYAFFGAMPPNMQARLLEVGVKANPYTHLYWMDNVKKYLHGQEGYDLILRRTFEATLYN